MTTAKKHLAVKIGDAVEYRESVCDSWKHAFFVADRVGIAKAHNRIEFPEGMQYRVIRIVDES